MRKATAATVLVMLIALGNLPAQLLAQEKPGEKLSVEVNLVRVDALVLHKGKPVLGLTKNDFEVYEDGVPQEVKYLDMAPLSVALLIDQSGSLEKVFQEVKDRSKFIFDLLPPDSEVAVIGFDHAINLSTNFTTNREKTALILSQIQNTKGGTNIVGALRHGIEKLAEVQGLRRRVIILISDNRHGSIITVGNTTTIEDKVAVSDKDGLVDALIHNEIVVYNIKVGEAIANMAPAPPGSGEGLARELVRINGGQMIEAREKKSAARALEIAVERLINTYSLYYIPHNQEKVGLRIVKTKLKDNPLLKRYLNLKRKYEIFSRKEYYLKKNRPAPY